MRSAIIKLKFIVAAFALTFVIPLLYIFRTQNAAIRKWWCRFSLKILGVKLEFIGELDSKTELFILNHQSLLDIMALEVLTPKNLCWVAKKELFNLFYYGGLLKAPRMIKVDREDKKGLLTLLSDVKNARAQDRQICIFPEGTRSKGLEMLAFKPGAKILAEKLHLRVQPIIVVDSARFITAKDATKPFSKTLRVIALESFDVNENWFNDVRVKMQQVLDSERELV